MIHITLLATYQILRVGVIVGWKQSTDIAIVSRVKKLILFHYSPDYNDEKIKEMETNAQKKFLNTFASNQELLIEL